MCAVAGLFIPKQPLATQNSKSSLQNIMGQQLRGMYSHIDFVAQASTRHYSTTGTIQGPLKVQFNAIWYHTATSPQYNRTQRNAIQCSTEATMQYNTSQHKQYNTIHYDTISHTTLHYTTLRYTTIVQYNSCLSSFLCFFFYFFFFLFFCWLGSLFTSSYASYIQSAWRFRLQLFRLRAWHICLSPLLSCMPGSCSLEHGGVPGCRYSWVWFLFCWWAPGYALALQRILNAHWLRIRRIQSQTISMMSSVSEWPMSWCRGGGNAYDVCMYISRNILDMCPIVWSASMQISTTSMQIMCLSWQFPLLISFSLSLSLSMCEGVCSDLFRGGPCCLTGPGKKNAFNISLTLVKS